MEYQTPADRVEAAEARLRRAMRLMVPAFALALIGFSLDLLATRIANRPLQLVGFTVGVCGVLIGFRGRLAHLVGRVTWRGQRQVAPAHSCLTSGCS